MKQSIAWFLFGAAVGILFVLCLGVWRNRPRDFSKGLSPETKHMLEETDYLYMSRARGYEAGPLSVVVPARPHHTLVHASISGKPHAPLFMVLDYNSNGVPDAFTLGDSEGCHVTFKDRDEDRSFDQMTYAIGVSTDSVSFVDRDVGGRL